MNCVFKKQEDKFVCIKCGFTTSIEGMNVNCRNVPIIQQPHTSKRPPSLLRRGINFAKASYSHFKEGFHHCSDEQKRKRYQICSSNKCGLFLEHGQGGICAHDDCGCFIRSNGKFMDKLSWAESKCPEGYWGPIEVKDAENLKNGV